MSSLYITPDIELKLFDNKTVAESHIIVTTQNGAKYLPLVESTRKGMTVTIQNGRRLTATDTALCIFIIEASMKPVAMSKKNKLELLPLSDIWFARWSFAGEMYILQTADKSIVYTSFNGWNWQAMQISKVKTENMNVRPRIQNIYRNGNGFNVEGRIPSINSYQLDNQLFGFTQNLSTTPTWDTEHTPSPQYKYNNAIQYPFDTQGEPWDNIYHTSIDKEALINKYAGMRTIYFKEAYLRSFFEEKGLEYPNFDDVGYTSYAGNRKEPVIPKKFATYKIPYVTYENLRGDSNIFYI